MLQIDTNRCYNLMLPCVATLNELSPRLDIHPFRARVSEFHLGLQNLPLP